MDEHAKASTNNKFRYTITAVALDCRSRETVVGLFGAQFTLNALAPRIGSHRSHRESPGQRATEEPRAAACLEWVHFRACNICPARTVGSPSGASRECSERRGWPRRRCRGCGSAPTLCTMRQHHNPTSQSSSNFHGFFPHALCPSAHGQSGHNPRKLPVVLSLVVRQHHNPTAEPSVAHERQPSYFKF